MLCISKYLMLVVCGIDVVIVESRGGGVGAVEVGRRRLLVSTSGSIVRKLTLNRIPSHFPYI